MLHEPPKEKEPELYLFPGEDLRLLWFLFVVYEKEMSEKMKDKIMREKSKRRDKSDKDYHNVKTLMKMLKKEKSARLFTFSRISHNLNAFETLSR